MPGIVDSKESSARDDLRRSLLRGDLEIADIQPVLTQLIGRQNGSCFSSEVLARVRAMLQSLAADLLLRMDGPTATPLSSEKCKAILEDISGNTLILCYIHSLVLEGYVTARLQAQLGLSATRPALLDGLCHDSDSPLGSLALGCVAAQTRFMALYERMDLRLADLAPEIGTSVLASCSASHGAGVGASVTSRPGRLSLLSDLADHPQFAPSQALDIAHAGFALFATVLAKQSAQERELVVMGVGSHHSTRIALALKSIGVSDELCQRNLSLLNTPVSELDALSAITASDAALILSQSGLVP